MCMWIHCLRYGMLYSLVVCVSEPVGTRMRPVPHPQRQLSGGVANPMRQHQQHSSPPPHVTHNSQLPSAEPVGTRMRPVPHPQRQLSGGVANSMRQHQQHSSPPPHVTHNSRLPSANNLSPPHTADPRPVQTHSTTAASHSQCCSIYIANIIAQCQVFSLISSYALSRTVVSAHT